MISTHFPILQVIVPLIAAPICIIFRQSLINWIFTTLICFISFLISCLLFNQIYSTGTISYALGGWPAPWGIEYIVDELTVYMLLIINGVASLVMFGSRESLSNEIASDRLYLFYAVYLLNLSGLLGVIVTGDIFNAFVFIEIASLSSYAMISISGDRRSLYAAFKYLILGTLGASFILISIGLLYVVTGTLNMADLYQKLPEVKHYQTLITALVFFIIGVGLKTAIFPLHLWLPDAYSYSPSIVSTFLAGTTTKVFLYILIRFIFSIFGYEFSINQIALNYLLMFMACSAILYGSFFAIKQDSIKRLLAYSSIAQIGYMVLGVSLATDAGLVAGLIHIFNHAIIKVSLFLSVVAIIYYCKTDSIAQLTGIAKLMPVTMALFLISGFSLIGMPLTVGFISKWFLIKAAFAAGYWFLVIVIVFSSILAMIYIWKIVEMAYFNKANIKEVIFTEKQRPYFLYCSLIIFVLANIYFGVNTSISVDLASEIAQSFF